MNKSKSLKSLQSEKRRIEDAIKVLKQTKKHIAEKIYRLNHPDIEYNRKKRWQENNRRKVLIIQNRYNRKKKKYAETL